MAIVANIIGSGSSCKLYTELTRYHIMSPGFTNVLVLCYLRNEAGWQIQRIHDDRVSSLMHMRRATQIGIYMIITVLDSG